MKITWNGHACFTIKCEEGTIVIDPYKDGYVPGLSPLDLKADLVLCSHEHGDHNAKEVVKLSDKETKFNIETIESYHDDQNGALRGKNTIHVINSEGMKVVHLGDLGCDINLSSIHKCDILMIPVGGHYTIDAIEAAALVKKIQPRIVFPMHYSSDTFGYDVLGSVKKFTRLMRNVEYYGSNNIEIFKDTQYQVAVLSYKG